MQYISLLQVYSYFWFCILAFFSLSFVSYKSFVIIEAILLLVFFLKYVVVKRRIPVRFVKLFLFLLIIALLYQMTPFLYSKSNERQQVYFLVFMGQILPAVLIGDLVAQDSNCLMKIKKFIPLVTVLFSLIAAYSVFNPYTYSTSGGVLTDYGLNYQNISYIASYASNFSLYCLLFFDKNDKVIDSLILKTKIKNSIFLILFFLDFFVVISSGGRGGFITFIGSNVLIFLLMLKTRKIRFNRIVRYGFGLLLLFLILTLLFNYASVSKTGVHGFNRIMGFFLYGSTSGRDSIYVNAFNSFLESPFWGHGFGSVFYEIGFYSHNLFLDLLIETGCLGTLIFIYFILRTFFLGIRLVEIEKTDVLWLIIFCQGLGMSMFSGYYLAHIPLYWGMSVVFSRYKWHLVHNE